MLELDQVVRKGACVVSASCDADRSWTAIRSLSIAADGKVEGVSGRTAYTAEITDLVALVCAVAAGQAALECVHADENFLGAQGRAR